MRQSVLETLDIRFGRVPEGLREEILAMRDAVRLRALHRTAVQCGSLESFAASL